jgi:ATP-dependent Lon protease
VRQLQRVIDALGRKAAVAVVQGRPGLSVRKSALPDLLGPGNVAEELLREPAVGMTMGLAWTSAGGSLLPIEALAMPGDGRTILTGSLGEVMRESVQTALSFVRSRFGAMGIAPDRLDSLDMHIHFPSGATPKDGPSAGVAVAVALVSLLTGVPARHDVAMSGEMSLTGAVLPVGALRDKLLAALRAGIREVVVPARNRDDVLRLPAEVRRELVIHLVDRTEDALTLALVLRGRSRLRVALDATARRRRIARRATGKKSKRRSA